MKNRSYGLLIAGVIAAIAFILGILMIARVLTNKSFVRAYENEQYDTKKEEALLVMNSPEGYVPYYNLGNASFKNEDYIAAVSYYVEALKTNPPEDKECLIRINLALAMCYTIDFEDLDTQEKKDDAIAILQSARAILLEKGFATDDGNGKSADAQQLKDDIEKMLEELTDNSQGSGDDNKDPNQNNSDDGNSDGNSSANKEDNIKKTLQKNKREALKESNEMQSSMEKWSGYVNGDGNEGSDYDYESKNW